MTEPRVSCIVPARNAEAYLGQALDSILAQTHPPHQVLVVDDGSTDGTAAVAERYGSPVTCMRQENRGPAAARNTALARATGEFVAFLDADDWWSLDRLEVQLAFMEANPAIDLCFAHSQAVFENEVAEEARTRVGRAMASGIGFYMIGTLLMRRSLYLTHGGFDEALRQGECTEWFLRLRSAGATAAVVDRILCYRRFHTGNTSREPGGYVDGLLNVVRAWRRFQASPAARSGDE